MISWSAALVLTQVVAPTAGAQVDEPKTVIVTAKRLAVTEKAWKDCIARACPPNEEADAALAHAENLFVDGDYFNAQRTLLTTIGHVDKRAADYPEAVGDLWRAQSRISTHMGERNQARIGQFESLDALRKGIPRSDSRVFAQQIAVADTLARQGKTDLAVDSYRRIAKSAERAHQPIVQGTALLRVALIDSAFYQADPAAFGTRIHKSIDAVLETTDPALETYRQAARLLRARMTVDPADTAAIDRMVAEFAPTGIDRPVMIYEPPFPPAIEEQRAADGKPAQIASDKDFDGQWADVSFRITPDGRVHDVEIAREAPKFDRRWIEPTLAVIAGRRYAPMATVANRRSLRRVERYTLTAYWEVVTGSRMRSRGVPRIEMLDLSNDVADAQPATSAPPSDGSVPAD